MEKHSEFPRSDSHTGKAISGCGFSQMSVGEDKSSVTVLAQSLLATISEITASVTGAEIEKENFMEIGCYLIRASPAILELQGTEYAPKNVVEILQSLSKNIKHVKDLVGKFLIGANPIADPELRSIMEQLEGAIKGVGEGLSLIPSSTFEGQEYAEVAVQSLSREMQNVKFEVGQTQVSEPPQPKLEVMPSEIPKVEQKSIESDLYSVPVEFLTENPQLLDMPRLIDFLRGMNNSGKMNHRSTSSQSLETLPQMAEYMEPLYETFICPLTKKIMNDPVTIASGVTYERNAITEWFKKFNDSEDAICPCTGQNLANRFLSTNAALRATIEQWKDRNDVTRIKLVRAALSLASSENMVLEALKDLRNLCQRKQSNKVLVCSFGMIPLLAQFLEYEDRKVRCATLETLQQLAEDNNIKVYIADTEAISTTIKMLSSKDLLERHASLLFLLELSRYEQLCEKIGSVSGGILLLITIKYNHLSDAFAAEKADETLRNLEKSSKNIRHMAENGFLEPLLNRLIGGTEEMQMEMGSCLGEIILGHENKIDVAERASPALLKMVHNGNTITRKAAFKALVQLSSYKPNSKTLIQAGIVQAMVEEMFTRRIYNEPMDSNKEAAAILANILESELSLETIQVNTHGLTMASDYVVYNIVHMLKNSSPNELNTNLIKILLCLTKYPKSTATIVSVVKETEASYTLIEFINSPDEELGVASMKLLITLTPYMGHTLADRLCKTKGQPESLIRNSTETIRISEKHAVSANFLAKLPQQNLTLNQALLNRNAVPIVLQTIKEIQRSGTRASRFANSYLEGLVGILVRFTTTLFDPQILILAKEHDFTSIFTELLIRTGNDEVQRLSAIGLERLSSESINLSKPPQIKRTKFMKLFHLPKFLSRGSSKGKRLQVCPVHKGACSSQTTFCLLDAKAVERLLACLDHENVQVIEAALSAICTLLDDKVDVDKSVSVLSDANAMQKVLNVLKEHREEGLWQKSFWMIERFLMKGGDRSASDISQDRWFPSTLVSAFHHGDANTRQMAEKILRHLNKMPNFSTKFVL